MSSRKWLRAALLCANLVAAPLLVAMVDAQAATDPTIPDPQAAMLVEQARQAGLTGSDLSALRHQAAAMPWFLGEGPQLESLARQVARAIDSATERDRGQVLDQLDRINQQLSQIQQDGFDYELSPLLAVNLAQVRGMALNARLPREVAQAGAAADAIQAQVGQTAQAVQADRDRAGVLAHQEDLAAAGDLNRVRSDIGDAANRATDELRTSELMSSDATGPLARVDAARGAAEAALTYQEAVSRYGTLASFEERARARLARVAPAKLITVSIGDQMVRAFENGREVLSTLATTGRPGLDTDTGDFHIYAKYSPFVMRSPWPKSSPYWYPDSPISFAMFFNGGDALHDAPWRYEYGPGSNFGLGGEPGTHGCVNVPYSAALWLWNWSSVGTQVTVYF
ncbi:MAG: L,D-transpeptidase [Candidatus Dormibacteria bacterium]